MLCLEILKTGAWALPIQESAEIWQYACCRDNYRSVTSFQIDIMIWNSENEKSVVTWKKLYSSEQVIVTLHRLFLQIISLFHIYLNIYFIFRAFQE